MRRDFSTQPRGRAGSLRDVLLVAAAGLAGLFAVREAWSARREVADARSVLSAVREETRSAEARIRAASPRQSGTAGALLLSRVLLTADAPPPRVLADLAVLLPADVRLLDFSLAYGERLDVDMRVEAKEAAAYDAFLERVQASPLFADLVPGAENRDGAVTATLHATYRPGGTP